MKRESLIGQELQGQAGRYQVVAEIARGGMGAIYRAVDCQDAKILAIKEACLDPDLCKDRRPEIRARLRMEMDVLRALDYPTLPHIYDQFATEHNEYLVMQFIEGLTLMQIQQRQLTRSRPLEEARVLGWALQALDTLDYMHSRPQPVFHRDIKPENLILAPDGRVMLVDFGLMKQAERLVEFEHSDYENFGTVEYAPPEQYADIDWEMDARSDLYSLGATLYYLLTGDLAPRPGDRDITFTTEASLRIPSIRAI
ncbi:MAG TPA: serine/threonine-protein kinase, partial [Anaerolineales bacterium]|nr:serine/threonine-protein kinase [Anaerolineales bacterium]